MVRLVVGVHGQRPFAVAAFLLGIRYVAESRDPRPGAFDLPGAVLSTAGYSLLVYAIIEGPGPQNAGFCLPVRKHAALEIHELKADNRAVAAIRAGSGWTTLAGER